MQSHSPLVSFWTLAMVFGFLFCGSKLVYSGGCKGRVVDMERHPE